MTSLLGHIGLLWGGRLSPYKTLVPIEGTIYYKFHERVAVSRGPLEGGQPLEDFEYCLWSAYQVDDTVVADRFDGTAWVEPTVIATGIVGTINHISLTFDANGNFVCFFEVSGNLFLRYYDTLLAANIVKPMGEGKSPFCSQEAFNSFLGPRQVHLVYVSKNNKLVYCLQDERYLYHVEFISYANDILAFGVTGYNNLKVTYVQDVGVTPLIKATATARKGVWQGEMPKNTFTLPEMLVEIKSADVYLDETSPANNSFDAVSFGLIVDNVSVSLANAMVTIDEPSPVDNSSDVVSFGLSVNNVSVTLSNIIIKALPVEPIPSALQHTSDSLLVTLTDTGVTTVQSELNALPPALEHSITFLTITVTP